MLFFALCGLRHDAQTLDSSCGEKIPSHVTYPIPQYWYVGSVSCCLGSLHCTWEPHFSQDVHLASDGSASVTFVEEYCEGSSSGSVLELDSLWTLTSSSRTLRVDEVASAIFLLHRMAKNFTSIVLVGLMQTVFLPFSS